MAFNKETGLYEGFLYCAINLINGKKYIGQTRYTVEFRWNSHIKDSRNKKDTNMIFHKAIAKYSKDNFEIIELEKISSDNVKDLVDLLNKKEIQFIQDFNTLIPNGYNICAGGNNVSEQQKKAVDQYDLDGNYIASYSSIMEASLITNITTSAISKCCLNKFSMSKNFVWRFKGDSYDSRLILNPNPLRKNNNKIKEYDFNGNLVQTYNNIYEISNDRCIRGRINECCQGKIFRTNGFIYRYENDDLNKYPIEQDYFNALKIKQYTFDNEFIKEFDSIVNASKFTGIGKSAIAKCVNKINKSAGGFLWYKSDETIDLNLKGGRELKKIYQYDIDGNFIEAYENIDIIVDKYNVSKGAIYGSCSGNEKTAIGYIWKYYKTDKINGYVDTRIKSVDQYDLDGNFINRYDTIKMASKETNIPYNRISCCLTKKQKTTGNFIWKYSKKDDNNENPTNTIAI